MAPVFRQPRTSSRRAPRSVLMQDFVFCSRSCPPRTASAIPRNAATTPKGSGAYGTDAPSPHESRRYTRPTRARRGKKYQAFIRLFDGGGRARRRRCRARRPRFSACASIPRQGNWEWWQHTRSPSCATPAEFPDFSTPRKRHPRTKCGRRPPMWEFPGAVRRSSGTNSPILMPDSPACPQKLSTAMVDVFLARTPTRSSTLKK